MKKWLIWLREHREDWPIFVSIIVFFLNIEIVVTPYILAGWIGLEGYNLRFMAGIWSTVEMPWWIYFSAWLPKEKMGGVGKSRLRDIFKPKSDDRFWLIKLKVFFNKHIVEKFDLENYRSDKLFKIIAGHLKDYGYLTNSVFILIFSLVPSYWVVALMVCRITRWFSLYAILLIGNFIKNYFFAYVYELIGLWWLLVVILIVLVVTGFIIKKILVNLSQRS